MPPPTGLPAGYEHLTPEMCLSCKGGKALCGMPCLWLARIDARLPQLKVTGRDVFGSSPPSVFVGRYGYPNVSLGPMLPPIELPEDRARELDSPPSWLDRRIEDVLGLRSTLMRTRKAVRVEDARRPPRLLSVTQELALSSTPVDTEVRLLKAPSQAWRPRLGDITAPMGPSVEPERVRLAGSPKVNPVVERLQRDTDARAGIAMSEMYRGGVDAYQIEKLLSVGLLGVQRDRRLVPTRWAITATDDQLGKHLIPKVQGLPVLDAVHVHEGTTHGNRFLVMLLPRPWSYDMIETWFEGAMWSLGTSPFIEDHEGPKGRTSYASNITGAYYAARLSVLEHLVGIRRQAAPFVYREITPDYWAPLGVWVIREGVKRALASPPRVLPDLRSALEYARPRTLKSGWDRQSWLVNDSRRQRRVTEYSG